MSFSKVMHALWVLVFFAPFFFFCISFVVCDTYCMVILFPLSFLSGYIMPHVYIYRVNLKIMPFLISNANNFLLLIPCEIKHK